MISNKYNSTMREALVATTEMLEKIFESFPNVTGGVDISDVAEVIDNTRAILAEPPRNCDVGTAEEQTARFRKFCSAHKYLGSDFSYMCKGFGKGRCPFFNSHTKSQCEFAWEQMTYEEGGKK